MTSSTQECHICLEELRRDLVTAPCGHVFHHVCILQALHVNPQCPICRRRTDDSNLITLYFDVSNVHETVSSSRSEEMGTLAPVANSGDTKALSSRVNSLMERIQWQNKQQDRLVDELRRLRSQSELLLADKQTLSERVGALQDTKTELLIKVARYQMELTRQTEAARQSSVNQSILRYLETCDAAALEEEIRNPTELIVALKKACKFRHDQYQKVVKEKIRLKEILHNNLQPFSGQLQRTPATDRVAKTKHRAPTRALETKRAYLTPSAEVGMGLQPQMMTNKKRKMDATSSVAVDPVPCVEHKGNDDSFGWNPRLESMGFAYSDVPIRPPPPVSRQFFGRSNFYSNQYGASSSTPSSRPVVQTTGSQAAGCRRGYDETGKLTNFFRPNEEVELRFSSRSKTVPSMQNLLDAQPISAGQQPRMASNDRQEYALTNWLRNN
uniref:RING-type domain-containing protein n=1 Tax=Hyaloperonospora arabidopsidis (strain Emoy2) TaxID=559515 RepID=M4BFU7_HYAAE